MKTAEMLHLQPDDVEAQLAFLLDRAAAHDEVSSIEVNLHRLCAATLRRDAAALAIILDDYEKAKSLLSLASLQFLDEQSFYGMALLSLVKGSLPWERLSQQMEGLRQRSPVSEVSRVSLEDETGVWLPQVEAVSAFQALSATSQRSVDMEKLRQQLAAEFKNSSVQAGAPELHAPFYFRVLERVASGVQASKARSPVFEMLALFAIREAELRAAQSDRYNWPMLLNPSDVVGFDMMFIGVSAIRHQWSLDAILDVIGGLDTAIGLPFKAASMLSTS